tara:strand:+ start:9165 stop:12656 length:3492 start_codon:yes stop_codon:yes gene_type:complete
VGSPGENLRPNWFRFIFIKHKAVVATVFLSLLLTIQFQNCAQSGATYVNNGQTQASPFADKKVVLNSKSFQDSSLESNDQAQDAAGSATNDSSIEKPKLKSSVRLLAKVNNVCAQSWCSNNQNRSAIVCQAYHQGPRKSLERSFQIYEVRNPGELNEDQLQAWVSKSPADQHCLKGISELRMYSQKAAFNDTNYSTQKPALDLINFEAAQTYFPVSSLGTVKVGVIDSGVAADTDLGNVAQRVNVSSWNATATPLFLGGDQTKPANFHGTFVAGIIGATRSNSNGIVGIAPNTSIYAYGVGNSLGQMTNLEIANAISDAVVDQMDVVNMSFGNSDGYYSDDPMIADGLVDGYNANILFVVAAGNSSANLDTNPSYPAQYSFTMQNVITVAASDNYGSLASFSNRSNTYVNIMAPGVQIISIYPSYLSHSTDRFDGTSFAAPMVTGAAALAIGYYRKKNMTLDVGNVRKLITFDGAKLRSDLNPYIKSGAFLDLEQLGKAIQTASAAQPLAISQARGVDGSGNPTLELTIAYDSSKFANVAAGSKIGIFDLSSGCNYSAPCLIQSVTWPPSSAVCSGNNCTFKVTLSRSQVITLMPSKDDANLKLPLSVAIYHVIDGKSVYAVDAASSINVREVAGSTGEALTGAVTNVRMDMQFFYVQGWTCLPGSEKAIPVGIVDSGGNAVVADYAYDYPFMVPHSTPIDSAGDLMWQSNVAGDTYTDGKPHTRALIASGIVASQTSKSRFPAGLEANPQMVNICKTLTAAHGFELMVPLSTIRNSSLSGKTFKIVASDSSDLALKDALGNDVFEFPEVVDKASENQFTITRDDVNYELTGKLCSGSPSPVEVEVSFMSYNFVWALTNARPDSIGNGAGLVSDTSLTATTQYPLPVETVQPTTSTDMTLKITKDTLTTTDTDPFTLAYKNYAQYPPNAAVGGPSAGGGTPDSLIAAFVSNVNSYNKFVRVGTGESIRYYQSLKSIAAGPGWAEKAAAYNTARSDILVPTTNTFTNPIYWDYYDVGEPFSTNLVGYDFNWHSKEVAKYLKTTYQITSALREVKKFETPLSKETGILGHGQLAINWSGSCASGYQHDLSSLKIENYSKYSPYYGTGANGFWLTSQQPKQYQAIAVAEAMKKLPITLRFFQDGKLVLHLESDSSSNFNQVNYNFR